MDLDVCSSSLDCRVDFNCDTSATGEALSELENVIHSEHQSRAGSIVPEGRCDTTCLELVGFLHLLFGDFFNGTL